MNTDIEFIDNKDWVVFGDSHASRTFLPALGGKQCHSFPACSAKGLGNKNSKLRVNEQILDLIHEKYATNPLIFIFGKVDLDFVSNYKFNNEQTFIPNTFIIESIDLYISFLQTIPKTNKIYVCEPYLPHQADEDLLLSIQREDHLTRIRQHEAIEVERRYSVIPQDDRIKLYLSYNKYLKKLCKRHGFHFLEINKYFKNSDGNFKIPQRFLPKNPADHHYACNKEIAELYLRNDT